MGQVSDKNMIFFDIDGTLVTEGTHILPESAREAIAKTRACGNLTFINTGRTYFNIDGYLKDLGFDGYICGCGTQIFYQGKELFASSVSKERSREIVLMLRECELPAFFEESQSIYFDPLSPLTPRDLMDLRAAFGGKNVEDLDESNWKTFHFDKFLIFPTTRSDMRRFRKEIEKDFCYLDRGFCAEIIQKDYSKATGIQFFCDMLGISLENCYAIGDSSNDLSMLEYVPHGIAMGNGVKEILPYCEYQTADIMDDGIYKALEHYGLLGNR